MVGDAAGHTAEDGIVPPPGELGQTVGRHMAGYRRRDLPRAGLRTGPRAISAVGLSRSWRHRGIARPGNGGRRSGWHRRLGHWRPGYREARTWGLGRRGLGRRGFGH